MFCSRCGTKLDDNAKFCSSCGSPVAAPAPQEPVYAAPAEPAQTVYSAPVEPAQPVYSAPVEPAQTAYSAPVESAQPVYSASDQPAQTVYSTPVEPVQTAQPVYSAPVEPVQTAQPAYSAPVEPVQTAQPAYSAPVESVQTAQPVYAAPVEPAQTVYSAPDQPAQTVYPAPDMNASASGAWGPLMSPKKKSKAPIIITLSVIALLAAVAVVVCCLIFCGGKKGSSSAEDALFSTIDSLAANDTEAVFETMHPIYGALFDGLLNVDSDYEEDASELRTYMMKNMLDTMSPETGKKFKYSNFKIESDEKLDKDEISEYNETITKQYDTYMDEFDSVGLDIGDIDDYMAEAAVRYEGTMTVRVSGGDEEECDFEAAVIKIDGSWYVAMLSVY